MDTNRMNGLTLLALRAYPNLTKSGGCSRHLDNGHFECNICYPDWHALLSGHMKVSNSLYNELLKLSGLSDPPNGRIGTNAILIELRRQLQAASK